MKTRIIFLCALLSTAIQTAHAATITVMNTNDGGPGSLRQALADAHDGDAINFAVRGTISLNRFGQLNVRKSISIVGPGAADLTIMNERGADFVVSPGFTVTIERLTISNGASEQDGGGIINRGSTVNVLFCVLRNNHADTGGAIQNNGHVVGHKSTLIIHRCTFSNNSALVGGAIDNSGFGNDTPVSVTSSTFDHNMATLMGGAIANISGGPGAKMTVSGCTFSANRVGNADFGGFGGAIANDGALEIVNSTFSGNSTTPGGYGGGVHNSGDHGSASLSISNSTFSGNTGGGCPGCGGSIDNMDMGARTTLINTIFNAGTVPSIHNERGIVTSHGYNLSSDNGGGVLTGIGDQINTDPRLGPLQYNGGPTYTHALLSGSPAINTGDPHFNPNTFDPPLIYDQRGSPYARVVSGRIDIGAFEVQ